jgi:threonine synthase
VGTAAASSGLHCPACGWEPGADDPYPFRCANAGTDDGDHVLHIQAHRLADDPTAFLGDPGEANPFVRHRRGLWAHRFATTHGMADGDWVALVRELDDAVAAVDGHGFRATPFAEQPALSSQLGLTVLVKDETGNVAGSHKARHLMGIMVHLLAVERLGLGPADRRRLAIASCGNAALGAAVVARAARWPLDVFVPPWADPAVVDRLTALGAAITTCPRRDGDPPGDPCVLRFREAVDAGAFPFGCQGPDNALALDGGRTLGFELAAAGAAVDRILVQVGGGALASSVAQGWQAAAPPLPRLHPVQTEGGHPLSRAWDAFVAEGRDLGEAVHHRSRYMWAWQPEPRSAATGILDDETYDWAAIVANVQASGGWPVVAPEARVLEAAALGPATTGIPVDATGTAGLAGLLTMLADDDPARRPSAGERVAVLFTGRQR